MTSTHGISIAALLVTLCVPARSGGGDGGSDATGEQGRWEGHDLDSLGNDTPIGDIVHSDNRQDASPIVQSIARINQTRSVGAAPIQVGRHL